MLRFMLLIGITACFINLPCSAMEPERTIKVFILAGQSNMEGHGFVGADPKRNGGKGSLEGIAKSKGSLPQFAKLVASQGNWVVRDDAYISYLDRSGKLTVGFGVNPDKIGPELGFGWVMADHFDAPVFIIKCAWGGKSLAVDFRPPSSGAVPYSLGEKTDQAIAADPQIVGKYYREILRLVPEGLARIPELIPGSEGLKPEIIGLGWHQGWNDRINDQFNKEYESNLANLIRDLRKEWDIPHLPVVIAETGMNGPSETHPRALSLMRAQAAVSEREEFRGSVAFVPTQRFWRAAEESPTGQGYHWNTNAETYYLIGEAMGEAMKQLVEVK